MTLDELREFKQKLLDKYHDNNKDKDIRHIMRIIDKIIERKLKQ